MSKIDADGPGSVWSESLTKLAVLISGGLDSAILLGDALQNGAGAEVQPLYVAEGLYWEPDERAHLGRFLEAVATPRLSPLVVLEMPVRDLYNDHWSVTGRGVPDASTADEAVYLPGRNVLLLSKAMLWCHLNECPAVALATLGSNPFPDAGPAFFVGFQAAVNQAVAGSVKIVRPYERMHKRDVMHRGRGLPLELTFSCIHPQAGAHCGRCNKCQERRQAFIEAGMTDPTPYASEGGRRKTT